MIRGALVSDITHFLDASGRVPDRPRPIVRFLGAIVAESSARPDGGTHVLKVKCRRRPGRRPCRGKIQAAVNQATGEIEWYCPVCNDRGYISNWQGSPCDTRSPRFRGLSGSPSPQFTPAAKRAWDTVSPQAKLRILNNVWCTMCRSTTSIILTQASIKQGDLVLQGSCSKCGGEVARLVERA